MSPPERIQKILAERGLASRRKAEEMIREGRVTVNGKIALIGEKADPEKDAVKVDGRRLSASPKKAYVLFYKPRKVVTTLRDPEERPTVLDLVAFPNLRLFPVGRLDFDAEGLILLTNDGDLAQRLTHPSHEVPRTYWVKVKGKPEKEEMERMRQGLRLEDGLTAPCQVAPLRETEGNTWVEMVLRERRNRQVKRMWEKLGYPVLKLKRVGFGGLKLGNLQPGEYRILGPEEVRRLKARAAIPAARTPSGRRPADRKPRREKQE